MQREMLILRKENEKYSQIKIKKLYVDPTIKNTELNKVLNLLDDFHQYKVALGLLAIQGLRPAELCDLTRDNFIFSNDGQRIVKMRHFVYKPKNNKSGITTYKEVEKPIYSKWLSDQLIGYMKTTPQYKFNKLFSFTTSDSLHKYLVNLRKNKGKEMPFLLEKINENVKGQANKTTYRFTLYSLRRFSFTFHYWVTYNKDAVQLAKIFGHSKVDTTLTHYIQRKEAIGLVESNNFKNTSLDEFIGLVPKTEQLTAFFEAIEKHTKETLVEGQRTLSQFI